MSKVKHIAINTETHRALKEYCLQECLKMGAFVEQLITDVLKHRIIPTRDKVNPNK
jgi:hypothetical protein